MDSNHRPITYEATALPTELFRRRKELYRELFNRQALISLDSNKQHYNCTSRYLDTSEGKSQSEYSNNVNNRKTNHRLDLRYSAKLMLYEN